MSERERWVVYPLLFLALGAALRDKLSDRTTTRSIKCQELLVIDEQPLGREVLLARIGRTDQSDSDGSSNGQFVLNGQIDVVDRDPSTNQLVHPLVTIGRAQLGPTGVTGGHVAVNGLVTVNGAINATFYAYQGVPIVPALRGVLPGASLPAELLRAIPEALAPKQPANASESAPPAAAPLADPAENR
ncbi:MAG: hypothetical protein L0228_02445 [Planctomycetes bacterium]|nr:hypothetical protein [Planctomycetota bacterium]